MIFQSQAERFSVLRQMKWSLAERYLKHPSACNYQYYEWFTL